MQSADCNAMIPKQRLLTAVAATDLSEVSLVVVKLNRSSAAGDSFAAGKNSPTACSYIPHQCSSCHHPKQKATFPDCCKVNAIQQRTQECRKQVLKVI